MRKIAFNLVVPRTELKVGFFTVDPVKALLGVSLTSILEEVLAPVRTGPTVVLASGGVNHDVFPLALEPDTGVAIPLGKYSAKLSGEIGIYNDRGALALHVPAPAQAAVEAGLGAMIRAGTARFVGYGNAGNVHSAIFEIRPEPGTQAGIQYGVLKLAFVF